MQVRRLVESQGFESVVAALIVANALAMGLEAEPIAAARWGDLLHVFFVASQVFFVGEIALRLVSAGGLRAFFTDPWDRFDFVVVAASLLPVVGGFAVVARLARILRVLRVFSAFDGLRELVGEAGATGGVAVPLAGVAGVMGYVFAIAGQALFREIDPAHWGGLSEAVRSVFFLAVLTDVQGIATPALDASPLSLVYFAGFYLVLATIGLHAVGAVARARGAA